MTRSLLTRLAMGISVMAGVGLSASMTPAAAQVRFAPGSESFYLFGSPYDESYDTHPSYQILPDRYGPVVHVIQRCAYPNGWNSGDFSRDLNGIPLGIDHTCPEDEGSAHVRARY